MMSDDSPQVREQPHAIRQRLEKRLELARHQYAVDVFAFYVAKDPFCPSFLRCWATAGARYPEAASHYRLKPIQTRGKPIDNMEGVLCEFYPNAKDPTSRNGNSPEVEELLKNDPTNNKLFGDFVTREDVVSRAIFLHLDPQRVADALLTVNYKKEIEGQAWRASYERGLAALFQNLVAELPQIEFLVTDVEPGKKDLYRSLTSVAAIIDPTQGAPNPRATAIDQVKRILRAVLRPYEIDEQDWCATIHLYDPVKKVLRYAAAIGNLPKPEPLEHPVATGKGVISWVALRQQAILINDLEKSKDFKRIHLPYYNPDIRSQLALPMMAGGELVGVLSLESTKPDVFKDWSVGYLKLAAGQATAAVLLSKVDTEHIAAAVHNLTGGGGPEAPPGAKAGEQEINGRSTPFPVAQYQGNRNRIPEEELQRYAGQWVAFSPDGASIVESGPDMATLDRRLTEAGRDLSDVVVGYIPDEDALVGGAELL
jgi:GAF domain-containing protein